MKFDIELVGKIGSMALIDKQSNMLNYTLIARLSSELKPGYIWITSGATETGRLDYIKRNGKELKGSAEDVKTDYSAQGQSILMSNYRQYVDAKYSIRQVLVEHQHFNDPQKREHLKAMLLRATEQNAIPIINYNDAISTEESRKFEIQSLKNKKVKVVECVDNDETATQIACLVKAKTLLILTEVLRDVDLKPKLRETSLVKLAVVMFCLWDNIVSMFLEISSSEIKSILGLTLFLITTSLLDASYKKSPILIIFPEFSDSLMAFKTCFFILDPALLIWQLSLTLLTTSFT